MIYQSTLCTWRHQASVQRSNTKQHLLKWSQRPWFPQMFKCAIFSFQIPILTTLIQPPLKASTTPWILTACCERPSIAWEGNEHHCTGWLQREGFAIPHCCFCSLNTRLQTFYTLCKWKEYMWTIKFYVYEGIYVYICKAKFTWT